MNPYINSDAQILKAEALRASIKEMLHKRTSTEEKWKILQSIENELTDDQYDILFYEIEDSTDI